ncbi:HlyD family secretion protein [Parahaliea mediterranea]|uniref:HlyD family secretion protein n=1 Tax=Parahaliea mediterranea TaxID=651086 RepID=UPI000E2EEF84|nr:HlyD family secretion protein [Parahaliea mediterranea]
MSGDSTTPAPQDSARSVNRGAIIIAALIALSLLWYLAANRFTPYTSQARVQGYVVGVAPKVAGLVTEVWVSNNQRVQAGQKLFQIDRSQYEIALQKANSDLDNARQQVAAGDATVTQAEAGLEAALAGQRKAEQDYTRLNRLRSDDPGTISARRLEVSAANLQAARAQVAAARAQIQAAIEQKGGASQENNTVLQVARTGVEKAQLDLDNTTVVAQSDGVITNLLAEVGQFAGTGNPVLTLVAVGDVWINADYTENNLGHLKPGTPVEILLDALPGQVFKGKVRDIGVGINASQSTPPGSLPNIQNDRDWLRQAQRFPVQVEFEKPIPAEVIRQLRIGGQASVIAYTDGHGLLGLLGALYIRVLSVFSYAY